jgi:hypothetical protein
VMPWLGILALVIFTAVMGGLCIHSYLSDD